MNALKYGSATVFLWLASFFVGKVTLSDEALADRLSRKEKDNKIRVEELYPDDVLADEFSRLRARLARDQNLLNDPIVVFEILQEHRHHLDKFRAVSGKSALVDKVITDRKLERLRAKLNEWESLLLTHT